MIEMVETDEEKEDALERILERLIAATNTPPSNPNGNNPEMVAKMTLTRRALADLINGLRRSLRDARQQSPAHYHRVLDAALTALRVGELHGAWWGGAHSLFEADRLRGLKLVRSAKAGARAREAPPAEVLCPEVMAIHKRLPHLKWTEVCRIVAQKYGISDRTVRNKTTLIRW